jgi:hypothetical protein
MDPERFALVPEGQDVGGGPSRGGGNEELLQDDHMPVPPASVRHEAVHGAGGRRSTCGVRGKTSGDGSKAASGSQVLTETDKDRVLRMTNVQETAAVERARVEDSVDGAAWASAAGGEVPCEAWPDAVVKIQDVALDVTEGPELRGIEARTPETCVGGEKVGS